MQPIKSSESVNSITFTPDFSMKWQIVLDSEIELNGFTQGYGKRSAKRLTQESVSGVIQDGSASGEYFDGTIKITLTMRDLGAGWMAIGVGKDMVSILITFLFSPFQNHRSDFFSYWSFLSLSKKK